MAIINIKGRESIKISNDRARELKDLLFDANQPRNLLIDLGSWSGELGSVRSIELDKDEVKGEPVENIEKRQQEERELLEKFVRLPAEEKARIQKIENWARFGTYYLLNHGAKPSEDLEVRVQQAVIEYYREHDIAHYVPKEVFADLLKM